MAQNLNIKINIKQIGIKIFDDILDKIQEVGKALSATDFSTLGNLNEIGKNLQESFSDIKESIQSVGEATKDIGNFIENTVNDIINNSVDSLTSGTQKGIDRSTKKIETALARISLLSASVIGYILASSTNIFGVFNVQTATLAGALKKTKELSIAPIFDFLNLKMLDVKKALFSYVDGINILSNNLFNIMPVVKGLTRLVGVLFVKAMVLNTVVLSLFSGVKFFRRLIGLGANAISPLERATNLITTMDKATGRLFLTWTHFFKMFSFGILTAFAPFIGIFPLLNSIVDVITIPITKFMDLFGRRLGSSRSSFILILQTVRELFAVAEPGLRIFIKNFAKVNEVSEKASKSIKKIKGETGALKNIANLKFPFMVQLQAFMSEAKKFLSEIFKQIAQILLTIQHVFAISGSKINSIFSHATNLTKNLQRNVEKNSNEIFKNFDKKIGTLQETFFSLFTFLKRAIKEVTTVAVVAIKGLSFIVLYPFQQIFFLIRGIYVIATFTIKAIFSFVKPFMMEVGELFKDLFVGIFYGFGSIFSQFFNLLKKGVIGFWNALSKGFYGLWSNVKSIGISILNIFKPKASKKMDPLTETQKKRAEEDKKSIKQAEITSKKFREIKEKEIEASKKTVEQVDKEKKATFELTTTKTKLAKIVDLSSVSKPLINISKEIILMTGTFDRVGTSIVKIKDVATPVSSLASIVAFKLQVFNVILQETIFNLLNLEVASKRGLTNLLAQVGKLAGIMDVFGVMTEQIAKGAKINVNVEKTMASLLKGLEQFSKKFGDAFAEERFKKISILFQKFLISGFKFDSKIVTKAFLNLEKEIKSLEKKGLVKGKDFGIKLKGMIALGLKGGNKEIEKALQLLTELIASFFPQSPAKRGPLKKLYQMGTKIVNYLIQGMLSKLSWIHRAAFKIAEIIAKFFPRSLPILGPLITIVKSGALIPYYLAKGMVQGIGSVAKAATNLAKTILASLQKATDLGFLAERIGVSVEKVSALENVLADVGATSSDLSFVFTRMRDTLNKTFDKKELDKIKALGINLKEIKNSGDPLINLFFKVSNVLKNIPISSKKAKKALELLGVTTHSKLINVLMKGGDEIKELMKQGVRLGTTYDSTFVKMSQKITGLLKRLYRVKDFLLMDFIKDILPKLEEFLKNILKQVEDNRINIQAFLKILYQSLIQVFILIKALFIYIITQPNKAFKFLTNGFVAFYNFTISIIKTLITFLSGEVTNFIFKIGLIIINSPLIIITRLFTGLTARLKVKNHELFMGIIKSIDSFFTKVIKYLKNFGTKAANAILEKIVSAILDFFNAIGGLLSYFGLGAEKVLAGSIKEVEKLKKTLTETVPKIGFIEKMDKRLIELKKKVKPISEGIIKDLKKIGDEADKSVKKTANGIDKVLADSKKAFDSTKKAFTNLIKDLKKGAEFLPDEFGEQINKFEKILSKVNFEKIKLGLEAEKNQQIANINTIDKTRNISKNKRVEDQEAIVAFLKTIQERITFNEMSEVDRRNEQARIKLVETHIKELQKFKELTEDKEKLSELFALYKVEMDELASEQSTEAWLKNLAMMGNIASGLENMFQEMYANTGETIKEFFYASKAAAIAQAIINIAVAITKAFEGGILGIAQAAVISAAGGMQIGKIMAQTLSFNKGGEVPGDGNTDTVSARLTPGEYIIPKSAVNFYGAEFMEALRQKVLPINLLSNVTANLPKPYSPPRMAFATGGLVPNQSQNQDSKQDINIVNVIDPNLLDKYLSSSTGQKQIINVLAANKYQVKRVIQ